MTERPPSKELTQVAARLRREWQSLATGRGDTTLSKLNEHLIEFNHYFHHAADDARISDDTLLTVVGEAFPVPWIHAAVQAARPAPGLDVDVVTVRARFEEEARRGIPSASAE